MLQTLISVEREGGRIYAKCPGDAVEAIARAQLDDDVWKGNVRIHWTLDTFPLERVRFWFEHG